jgi:hypothetical protein
MICLVESATTADCLSLSFDNFSKNRKSALVNRLRVHFHLAKKQNQKHYALFFHCPALPQQMTSRQRTN